MNSPSDSAEDEKAPVVCTVAGPRLPYSTEVYTGAELRPTSLRRGAYDALTLPSVFNGRRHTPAQAAPAANIVHTSGRAERSMAAVRKTIAQLDRFSAAGSEAAAAVHQFAEVAKAIKPARSQGPLRELTPARVARGGYFPKPGSIPSLVLAHLQEHGGHLTYSEVTQRFGLPQSSVTAVFKKALASQVLVRLVTNARVAFALPGYVPPPDTPRPSKDLRAMQARLEKRMAEVAELQREVLALQASSQPTAEATR